MSDAPAPVVRSVRLDALRGLAVLGMIVAHAIFFFHNNTSPDIVSLQRILNTTVFTLFIFVSGLAISRYLDDHAHLGKRHLAKMMLQRAGLFYVTYVITAIAALLTTTPLFTAPELIEKLPGALLALSPPSFTEYLPFFILLSLSLIPLWEVLHFTRQSILMTIITGGFAYTLGILLFPLDMGALESIKQLFVGGGTALRFPLLFYFPVFLWGLWWQHFVDHVQQDNAALRTRTAVIIAAASITIVSIIASYWYHIPLLDPATRWPPSIAYLTAGIALSTILLSILPSMRWVGRVPTRIMAYMGRDALDLWLSHLLLLFIYRRLVGIQFSSIGPVFVLTLILLVASFIMSSMVLTNRIAFPFKITLVGATRLRIRYVVLCVLLGIALFLSLNAPIFSGATYGNFMVSAPLTAQKRLPDTAEVQLTTDRTWYVHHNKDRDSVDITVKVLSGSEVVTVSADSIAIYVGNTIKELPSVSGTEGSVHYSLLLTDLAPGEYPIWAEVDNGGATLKSKTVKIMVSEPFLVAWTFDWEGWDVTDAALAKLQEYGSFDSIHFTHFVSPRTFLPGVLSPERASLIAQYLQNRQKKGDEIAHHLHMHFDLVNAAGVSVRSDEPWGLYSQDGYDVPTTQYSPEEFRLILSFSRNLATSSGLPNPLGFRAGGWFMNDALLTVLSQEGFVYDSSARDKPATGPFSSLPWNVPIGAQPYLVANTSLLEIPNNGVSTSESTSVQLLERARQLYPGGILTTPKTFVVVSHPQFALKEFPRIPIVLTQLIDQSVYKDAGPVVFVTMSEINTIWTSLLH